MLTPFGPAGATGAVGRWWASRHRSWWWPWSRPWWMWRPRGGVSWSSSCNRPAPARPPRRPAASRATSGGPGHGGGRVGVIDRGVRHLSGSVDRATPGDYGRSARADRNAGPLAPGSEVEARQLGEPGSGPRHGLGPAIPVERRPRARPGPSGPTARPRRRAPTRCPAPARRRRRRPAWWPRPPARSRPAAGLASARACTKVGLRLMPPSMRSVSDRQLAVQLDRVDQVGAPLGHALRAPPAPPGAGPRRGSGPAACPGRRSPTSGCPARAAPGT